MTNSERYEAIAERTKAEVVRMLGAVLADVWEGKIDCGECMQLAAMCETLRMLISKVEGSAEAMEKLARGG